MTWNRSLHAAPVRSRQIKALLAGGTVLGIGAAVTLAAWTDDVWVGADFSAGSFTVESSATGADGSFDNHSSESDALELDFQIGATGNLSPGDALAAPLVLRIAEGTTYDAVVSLEAAAGSGNNADAFTYGIVRVPDSVACTVDATGDVVVPVGTTLDSVANASDIPLAAGQDDSAGPLVSLCFQVLADDSLEQGESASAMWQFVATSVE